MNRIRTILGPIAALMLLGVNIWESWNSQRSLSTLAQSQQGERDYSMEERLLLFQTKVLVGAKVYIPELLKTHPGVGTKDLDSQLSKTLKDVGKQVVKPAPETPEDETGRMLVREKAIVAARFGDWDEANLLLDSLPGLNSPDLERTVDRILTRVLHDQQAGRIGETTGEEKALLSAELLDFANFLKVNESAGGLVLSPDVAAVARDSWLRFFATFAVFFTLVFVALVSFCVFLFIFLTGRAKWRFDPGNVRPCLLIETFVLYFGMMAFSPKILEVMMHHHIVPNALIGNVVLILATALTLLWPLTHGVGFGALARILGLAIGPFKKFIADLIVAPFFYLASWVMIFAALFLYSIALSYFNVNISQGAHPIIPILLNSNDAETSLLITILAVVVAPFIEEIMFRGVLYGYLRQYFRALYAIPLSAFIFAAVHPQGLIGLVPLTAIGILLATLREWRGSLTSSMVAHACVNGGTLLLITSLFR